MENPGFLVRGPLALVLQMSRFLGVAPLRMESRSNGYYAQISSSMTYYNRFLLVILGILTLVGVIMDLMVFGTNESARMNTLSSLVMSLVDVTTLIIITAIGVIQGPYRMTRIMAHLKNIDKVNQRLKKVKGVSRDQKLTAAIVGITIGVYVVLGADSGYHILDAMIHGKRMIIVYVFECQHYLKTSTALFLNMQIALVILLVKSALKTINNRLRELVQLMDECVKHVKKISMHTLGFEFEMTMLTIYPLAAVYATKWTKTSMDIRQEYLFQRRIQLDQKHKVLSKRQDDKFYVNFSVENNLREIANCYFTICNVVKDINEDNGLLLIAMYISFIIYLIVSIYSLIAAICSPTGFMRNYVIVLQVMWIAYQWLKILIIIEPCHRTHQEMEETRVLASQLTYRMTPPGQPLPVELEIFHKQLILYTPSFSPIGICTLNRSQIAAIISGVTTYILIMVQQKFIDECK